MSKLNIAVAAGIFCYLFGMVSDQALQYLFRQRRARTEFRDTFQAALNIFNPNANTIPIAPQEYLASLLSQYAIALRLKRTFIRSSAKAKLQKAWDQYYLYIINNKFKSWFDEHNSLDPGDTATQTFKMRTHERIQAILAVLD